MRLASHTIGHNTALDSATQYNIQVNLATFINGKLEETRNSASGEAMIQFLTSFLPQKENHTFSSRMGSDTSSSLRSDSESMESLRSGCSEMRATSRRDWSRSVQAYCPRSRPAIQNLKLEHLTSISDWLAAIGSTILLVEVVVKELPPGPSWATDFVLEMASYFETPNSGFKANSGAIVTHLCRKESAQKYGERGLLQDILDQILEADPERSENPGKYRQVGFEEHKLYFGEYKLEELWHWIVQCLKVTRIRYLVIMLDHIEEVFLETLIDDPSRYRRFIQDLDSYTTALYRDCGITVKTMVTCRLDAAACDFYKIKASRITIQQPSRRQHSNRDDW
ncbi:hypothetical protein F4808DRAFT_191967 [Astrocystis sublimbata]|nr:hypothetical protein F4808DRAFT_191967 [Astrocystis sublimbata]